jgi:hypothetical protein
METFFIIGVGFLARHEIAKHTKPLSFLNASRSILNVSIPSHIHESFISTDHQSHQDQWEFQQCFDFLFLALGNQGAEGHDEL